MGVVTAAQHFTSHGFHQILLCSPVKATFDQQQLVVQNDALEREYIYVKRPTKKPFEKEKEVAIGLPGSPLICTEPKNSDAPERFSSNEGILEALENDILKGNLRSAIEQIQALPIDVGVRSSTYASLLKLCGHEKRLLYGKLVHDHIRRNNMQHKTFLGNHLINMYRRCGDVPSAVNAFNDIATKNVFSWTIMMSTYADHELYEESLSLFKEMQDKHVMPDKVTVSTIIGICTSISSLEKGRQIHRMILDGKLESDVVVESGLVNMYVKCGSLEDARRIFDSMRSRTVITWTIMINAYVENNLGKEALHLFEEMRNDAVKPNEFTLIGALSACSTLGSLEYGNKVHAAVVENGLENNVLVGNALIHMYGKCGSYKSAWKVFCKMNGRDVITWTSMLDVYMKQGRTKDTLQLFEEMQWEGIIPDRVTFLSILAACADLCALEQGKKIHSLITSRKLHTDELVGCSLIHMYGRCGSVEEAEEVFNGIKEHSVHTWTSMITVYSQHGLVEECLLLFQKMLLKKVKPNAVTFVSVLSACSQAGLVMEGWGCFNSINSDYNITPTTEHYACIVDLLGRSGFLNEAEIFIKKLPIKPDILIWRTMLSACTVFNDIERGKIAAENCISIQPTYAAPYILLTNIYASCGQWEEVARVRRLMELNGVKARSGRSSIEIKDKIHEFMVDDLAHPQIDEIRAEVDRLTEEIEGAGYIPASKISMHDVEEEVNTLSLKYHSERLAIAFGHMRKPPGSTIHITKNLRVCADCHTAIKYLSKILEREIVLRDSHQFHHFSNGICSCRDYW